LKFGSGRFEDRRCGVKGNVVASPGAFDGRGDEHNPGRLVRCQSGLRTI
jgi:hypothetical protein